MARRLASAIGRPAFLRADRRAGRAPLARPRRRLRGPARQQRRPPRGAAPRAARTAGRRAAADRAAARTAPRLPTAMRHPTHGWAPTAWAAPRGADARVCCIAGWRARRLVAMAGTAVTVDSRDVHAGGLQPARLRPDAARARTKALRASRRATGEVDRLPDRHQRRADHRPAACGWPRCRRALSTATHAAAVAHRPPGAARPPQALR
ncbi:MAG: hypothetical protein MZW92_36710 [Comamonadaceae bacterium]|nr:hypothetical protein [Comamonadaceae bacterium]